MTIYAFMDTGAGYFQGAETADTLDNAIRAYARRVGLIEEIDLAMHVAEVTKEQERVLADHCNFRGMSEDEEALSNSIAWRVVSDDTVREALGFTSRDEE